MSNIYTGSVDRGRRDGGDEWVVRRNGQRLDPSRSLTVFNHSPDGFAWGYRGSGPAQLALALLLEEGVDPDTAVLMHQRFKEDTVATWPQESDCRITSEEIHAWLSTEAAP